MGSLLLTFKLSSSLAGIFQSSLGNVRLHFSDLGSKNMDFCPTTAGNEVKLFSFDKSSMWFSELQTRCPSGEIFLDCYHF